MEALHIIIFKIRRFQCWCVFSSERLLEVVELYSSTACYDYIIIVIPDFAQGLSSACILNERTCEKSSASGVVQAATSAAEWCHVWVYLRPASVCCEKLERWLEKRVNGWTVSRLKFLSWICLMYPLLTHVFSEVLSTNTLTAFVFYHNCACII